MEQKSIGAIMKVGDLVKWRNGDNEYELGIVKVVGKKRAFVWFFTDHAYSWMVMHGLEVIHESR